MKTAKGAALARSRDSATRGPAPKRRVAGRLLDARRDRLDLRDRPYQPSLASLLDQYPPERELQIYLKQYVAAKLILDQGEEGACTGFGLACVVNHLLWIKAGCPAKFASVSPRMLYHLARMYDEWPGEDYEGSSCRGALKGWHKHGVCSAHKWPYRDAKKNVVFVPPDGDWAEDALSRTLGLYYRIDQRSVVDMQAAIHEIGAIYVSADVHAGWDMDQVKKTPTFANLPRIPWTSKTRVDGGHAFALVGYNNVGFVVQNSWTETWGLGGFALLSYEEWVANGFDAWACALGVPKPTALRAPEERTAFAPAGPARSFPRAPNLAFPSPKEKGGATEYRLSEDEAYHRTIVMANDGYVQRRVVEHADADDTVARLGNDIPAQWLKDHVKSDKYRVLLYAHGGLNSEADSIARIRALGYAFQDNGIYPLFLTWKTGFKECIVSILEDQVIEMAPTAGGMREWIHDLKEKVAEAKDRTIEVASRKLVVRALWDQMKQNAEAAVVPGRGGERLAQAIGVLAASLGDKLEIHLVGHSAGSIILGHLLPLLPQRIASCTLYAPACTVEFANTHYAPALARGQLKGSKFRVYVMSEEREQGDTVGPYGKSLLYLVSRALEPLHKTPILGLELAYQSKYNGSYQWNDENENLRKQVSQQLKLWQQSWSGAGAKLFVEDRASVSMGSDPAAGSTPTAHGCFDNDAEAIDETMAVILGAKPPRPARNLAY